MYLSIKCGINKAGPYKGKHLQSVITYVYSSHPLVEEDDEFVLLLSLQLTSCWGII